MSRLSIIRRAPARSIVLALSLTAAANLHAAALHAETTAFTGATVHPVTGPSIAGATVVVTDGKIAAVGVGVTPPAGAKVVSCAGKHIYPGLISANTVLGLIEVSSVLGTNDQNETGTVNPNIRAEVGVNPESEIIPVTRANGVTMAVIAPGGGAIAGSAAALTLDGWTWEDMTLRAPVGMVIYWPQMTINRAPWEQRSEEEQKKSRDKALNDLRNAFKDARAYLKAKNSEGQGNTPRHDVDVRWEAMAPVLERKIPALIVAAEVQQIEAAVAWAGQENIRMVLVSGGEACRVAGLLKGRDIPVILGPIQTLPERSWEAYDMPFEAPKKLYEAGVKFCITGDRDASNTRNLPYHAATAAAYGLPKDEALKAVTLYPAQILGLDDRIGSLEIGKDATFIVTNGDPLEVVTNVEREFICGKDIPLTSKHTRLYEKYREKYRRISGKN